MASVRVDSIMTTSVVTVSEADNLATIAASLETYRFRHLPVVDADVLVGIVSERDLLRASVSGIDTTAVARSRASVLGETFVHRVMSPEPRTIPPETSLQEAARIMIETRVGCLPVVDDDRKLLGIVTEYDLLKWLASSE